VHGLITFKSACGFALWRFVEIINTGGGVASDPTWNMPASAMLSTVEIFLAALCATIPFFWPAVVDQFNKIFVQYDFSVSEVRVQDEDKFELTKTGSMPGSAGLRPNEPWLEETWPPEKKSTMTTTNATSKPVFKEEFSMGQVSPYGTSPNAPNELPSNTPNHRY
jgi:hypothetical protein